MRTRFFAGCTAFPPKVFAAGFGKALPLALPDSAAADDDDDVASCSDCCAPASASAASACGPDDAKKGNSFMLLIFGGGVDIRAASSPSPAVSKPYVPSVGTPTYQ